jgi:hypothetical protein
MRIYQWNITGILLSIPTFPVFATTLLLENAENGTSGITERTLDVFDLVQTEVVAEGNYAFFLGHPRSGAGPDQAIEINRTFTADSSTNLYFESRLGYSTPLQTVYVDVQETGKSTWNTVWSESGWYTGSESPPPFSLETVSLASFAGKTIKLRFRHALGTGGYIPAETNEGADYNLGWVFDNIQVGDTFTTRAWDIGAPTAQEQLVLEYINRARGDSLGDIARLSNEDDIGIDAAYVQFGVDLTAFANQFAGTDFGPGAQQTGNDNPIPVSMPPLAPNPKLLEAARLHTEDMFNNQFQGHSSSSSPVSPNEPGDQIAQRVAKQGYDWISVAENVSSFSSNLWESHAAFVVDWGTSGTTGLTYKGMQDPAGHRNNIFGDNFREIGVAVIEGTNGIVGPILVTHAFATEQTRDQPFVTGVAYHDFDGDGFYSAGEGVGGITCTSAGSVYHCETPASGGYALPLQEDGSFTLGVELPDGSTRSIPFGIQDMENRKVDVVLTWDAPVPNGRSSAAAGSQEVYSIDPEPTATGYRWCLRAASDWSGYYDAESSEPLTGSPDNNHVAALFRPSGTGTGLAYRMISPDGLDAFLTLDNEILPGSGASLRWQDFPGLVEATQSLVLQASVDGGTTWDTLETRDGLGQSNAAHSFSSRNVSLSIYAGKATLVRFGISNPPSTLYYSNTESQFGWYVDDIEFLDAQVLSSPTEEDTSTPSWTFTPSGEGNFVLQSKVLNMTNVYPGGAFLPITVTGAPSLVTLLSASELSGGWKLSPWLGMFYQQDENWIYRGNLGWLYFGGKAGSGIWFYAPDSFGWIWAGSSVFPYFYRSSDNSWYYIIEEDAYTEVYRYDANSASWETVTP